MFKTPTTLSDLNASLAAIGLPAIGSRSELEGLFDRIGDDEVSGRDRLTNALRDAINPSNRGRGNAVAYLRTHIAAVKAAPANANDSAPQTSRNESAPPQSPSREDAGRVSHDRGEMAGRSRPAHSAPRQQQSTTRTQTPRGSETASGGGHEQEPNERLKVRAYGRKAALCAESDITRGNVPTVRFEIGNSIGEKQFDWKNKLVFQLTEDEIIEIAVVLLGMVPSVNFRNHGDDGKWLAVENQGRQLCIKAGTKQANSMRIVPINIGRATALAALVMRQVNAALFEVGDTGMLPLVLHKVTARMLTADEREGRAATAGQRHGSQG